MKNTTIGIIIGICVTVTAFHVWYLYKINTRIVQLENFGVQVANLLNNQQK